MPLSYTIFISFEYILRKDTNGQQVAEKVLNFTNHQGNAN